MPTIDYDAWRREAFAREILRMWFGGRPRERPADDLIGLIGESEGSAGRPGGRDREPLPPLDSTRHPFRVGIPPG